MQMTTFSTELIIAKQSIGSPRFRQAIHNEQTHVRDYEIYRRQAGIYIVT